MPLEAGTFARAMVLAIIWTNETRRGTSSLKISRHDAVGDKPDSR